MLIQSASQISCQAGVVTAAPVKPPSQAKGSTCPWLHGRCRVTGAGLPKGGEREGGVVVCVHASHRHPSPWPPPPGQHLALVVDVLVLVDFALHMRVCVCVHVCVEFGVQLGASSRAGAQQVLGGRWDPKLLTQP